MNTTELFAKFHEVASSPKKQLDNYLAAGEKVVVCAPIYTPEEIIHAMGIVPMGVWGADIEVKEAKRYFPAFICSIMQSVLELGIQGAYQGVSAIIIPALCDSLKCLGQNWKYAVTDIPFIPMTYPQNRKADFGIAFTKAGYERVITDLEKATGYTFDAENLKKSIAVYNRHNEVMREFSQAVGTYAQITTAQRSDVFKSAYFMKKEEHTVLVEELLAALKEEPVNAKAKVKVKVVTSGILVDSPSLLEIFDENGLQIVADDVAHESRQYRVDTTDMENPMEALAVKFANYDNCSVLYDPDKKRASWIVEEAKKTGAQGVIVVMTKFCDPEEFDYVIIKKECEKANIPLFQVEVDRQMGNYQQANTMIQTFVENL